MKIEKRKIGIIGAGKFAFSFAPALLKNNFKIESIISRSLQSARTLAKKVSAKNYSNKISSLSNDSNLVFICVPDDQIKNVAIKISKLKLQFEKIIFIHTSGAKTSEELSSLKIKGALTASFHLMQTFPSKKIIELKDTFTAIESDFVELQKELLRFAKLLKLNPVVVSARDKILYHIGGVFAANFLSANFLAAEQIFPIKLKDQTAKVLGPIAESTLSNIVENSPSNSISGPIDRGDIMTIQSHINSLKSLGNSGQDKLLLLSYLVQSKILLNGIKKKYGRLNINQNKIKKYLDAELNKLVRLK